MNFFDSTLTFLDALFDNIFKVLGPIILLTIFWILIKIIYRYKKYGMVEFNVFKKREETKFIDIILSMLDKIEGYRKVYKPSNLYADLVIIDKTGIYLLKLIKYVGIVTGNRNNLKLKNQIKLKQIIDIDNPFYYLDKDISKIEKTLNIKTILVTSNTVNVNIDKVSKEECIMLKDFYYYLDHIFKQEGIYDKEKINNIYKELQRIKEL